LAGCTRRRLVPVERSDCCRKDCILTRAVQGAEVHFRNSECQQGDHIAYSIQSETHNQWNNSSVMGLAEVQYEVQKIKYLLLQMQQQLFSEITPRETHSKFASMQQKLNVSNTKLRTW